MSLSLLSSIEEERGIMESTLTVLAFFHPFQISERIFTTGSSTTSSPLAYFYTNGQWNHTKFRDAIVEMQQLSLVQFSVCDENEIAMSLHPLVSDWLRMRGADNSRSSVL